ncbi:MAG: septum formation inhibitor Maf [Acidobacteriota bacterium]
MTSAFLRSRPTHGLVLAGLVLLGCQAVAQEQPRLSKPSRSSFDGQWNRGLAEVTTYDLEQARYGEIHRGQAVLIYVTEDLSAAKQVKLDRPDLNPADAVRVLKLNTTKKFYTGVYPYSVMQSTFTPVDRRAHPRTLKSTMSSQEWCGHVFTQANLRGNEYVIDAYSYFESEGDTEERFAGAMLEDELWTLVRIDPSALPTGSVKMLPGFVHSRLRHVPLRVENAKATLTRGRFAGTSVASYTVDYPRLNRSLTLHFEESFPHAVVGFEERQQSRGKTLTTRGTRSKSKMIDYWNRNGVADGALRAEMGLE